MGQAQLKQSIGVEFYQTKPFNIVPQRLPKIAWEVPPPDFDIPDDPLDDLDQY